MSKTQIQQLCDLLAEFLDKSPQTSDDPHLDKALLIAECLRHQRRNQFEFNELVEVRDFDREKWVQRHYIGSVTTIDGREEYLTYKLHQSADWHRSRDYKSWYQIRKIQP